MTYEQIKEKYYNDEISLLPAKEKATLEKILNDWFGGTSFDEVEKITGMNIWDYPEAIDVEDSSKETDRDEALEFAKGEWNAKSLEIRTKYYVEIGEH